MKNMDFLNSPTVPSFSQGAFSTAPLSLVFSGCMANAGAHSRRVSSVELDHIVREYLCKQIHVIIDTRR